MHALCLIGTIDVCNNYVYEIEVCVELLRGRTLPYADRLAWISRELELESYRLNGLVDRRIN